MAVENCFKILLCFAALSVLQVSGLTCWTCTNATHFLECLTSGTNVTCEADQNACGLEVNPSSYSMGCKSVVDIQSCATQEEDDIAQCRDVYTQLPNQVNRCTCCCDTDNCNSLLSGPCLPFVGPPCPPPPTPSNGRRNCSRGDDDLRIGTTCVFQCDPGYYADSTTSQLCNIFTGISQFGDSPSCISLQDQTRNIFDIIVALDNTLPALVKYLIIQDIKGRFILGPEDTLIGVVAFSGNKVSLTRLNLNSEQIGTYLPNNLTLAVIAEPTLTDYVNANLFTSANGDRPNAPNVLAIFVPEGAVIVKNNVPTTIPLRRSDKLSDFTRQIEAAIVN